jgi:hypothetical protein
LKGFVGLVPGDTSSTKALVDCVRNLIDETGRVIKRPPVQAAIFIKSKRLICKFFSKKPFDCYACIYNTGMILNAYSSLRVCRIIFHEEGKGFPFLRL